MKSNGKMLYLVNLPNGTTFGIQCDPKAIGQKCLEEVCKNLGFTCETEYFGLVDCSKDTRDTYVRSSMSQYDWINLRNPLGHGTGGQPYSLQFRVKFWVPAHMLLQDSVRNIFFMQARSDLLEGRLLALDWENAAQLSALLAHADEVKFDARSLNCESDPVAELLATTMESTHCLQPLSSNQKDNKSKKRKLSKQKSVFDDDDEPENGSTSSEEHSPLRVYLDYVVRPSETAFSDIPADIGRRIAIEHQKLMKMPSKSAKYWLLQEIFKLPGFGVETFSGIILSSTNGLPSITPIPNCASIQSNSVTQRCDISVGPHGLFIDTQDEQIRIPFSAASSATPFKRNFKLCYLSENNEHEEFEIKLPRPRIAIALYRAITEKHAFYSCETVGTDVTKQFVRDFKGTIASMFNMYTKLGKLYVFDIQRTYREVYDHARRVLHSRGIDVTPSLTTTTALDLEATNSFHSGDIFGTTSNVNSEEMLHKMEKEVADRITEAITCRICMDREIDTSYSPCGHIVSCSECSQMLKCDRCPLCRAKIRNINKVYLPTELRTTATITAIH